MTMVRKDRREQRIRSLLAAKTSASKFADELMVFDNTDINMLAGVLDQLIPGEYRATRPRLAEACEKLAKRRATLGPVGVGLARLGATHGYHFSPDCWRDLFRGIMVIRLSLA